MTDAERETLRALIRDRSFKTGQFTLASGRTSTLYFNLKPTMMHARGAELAARGMLDLAREVDAEYVGGLEMGAVPLIGSMIALASAGRQALDAFFVRKKPKDHGTQEVVEGLAPGESLAGRRALLIDDVATTAGSTLIAVQAARAAGAVVTHAAVIVDRQEGGTELLAEHGVTLLSLFRACDFTGARAGAAA